MEFHIQKQEQKYLIKEDGRIVFYGDYEIEEKLISLYLRNIYGDEAIGLYQVKKWYTGIFPKLSQSYTIYEQENKLGELQNASKGIRLMEYQGITYRFYGGVHGSSYEMLCYERNRLCAKMLFDDEVTVEFYNSSMGALFAALAVLCKEFRLYEGLSQTAFMEKLRTIKE